MKYLLLIFIFTLTSCLEPPSTRRLPIGDGKAIEGDGDLGGEGGAAPGDSTIDTDTGITISKVELRHIIEPKVDDSSDGGNYKRKLTIPKNYNGQLYFAGVNITTLNSQNVKVRFNFGRDSSPITLQATVSTAPGLIPQTNVQVLVIDMQDRPFQDVNLLYDLYDYNTYDFDQTSSLPGVLTEPVSFNRDDNLFCRGLSLKDDPTFTGNLTDGCKESDDVCKFAYVQVKDKGLVRQPASGPEVPLIPAEISAEAAGNGYYDDTDEIKIKRCLPDDPSLSANAYKYDEAISFLTFGSIQAIGGENFIYRGPYQPFNVSNWEISSAALKGEFGVFGEIFDDNVNGEVDEAEIEFGYKSKLFPLYTRFPFNSGLEYLGSNDPHGEKVLLEMNSNTESQYMDGCNERVSTVHGVTGEHIGSCNVTATIEIVATDFDGNESVMDITNEVKLQLVKPASLNTEGENVLLSSFRSCSSTSQCGSDSCCINKRCWSKTIVSQCVEDLPTFGNLEPGDQCTSDSECASLCCDQTRGKCAPHDPDNTEQPVFCSKNTGQKCIADDWCATTPIPVCAIVNTGFDAQGNITCALRCVTVQQNAKCVPQDSRGVASGVCVPPTPPQQPDFNPDDPNRCDDAIEIEELLEQANAR